ncbi:(2Fe-2S)-binding protein [bacterium]|nr:(2Fe-2S)-binding protein [bacterium]
MTVNGVPKRMTVSAGKLLSEVLREDLHLTGVKIGCNAAECGSCTVLVNGRPVYSCRTLAALADGALVETIEGISGVSEGGNLHPIQKSFIEADALQCGYCTPGMICAAKALFIRNPRPDDDQIRAGLAGNICRCGAYDNILKAVRAAVGR